MLAFEVSLDATSSNDVSVDYATRDGTAVAGEDYTATSGTLTFGPGDIVRYLSLHHGDIFGELRKLVDATKIVAEAAT